MRVVRVLNSREFEVDGELSIGEFVKVGKELAVVVEVYCEDPEIVKYMSKFDLDEIKEFLPDLAEPKNYARCFLLSEGRVSIGEKVELAEDEEIKKVHWKDDDLYMPYIPELVSKYPKVAIDVIKKLESLFPEEKDVLRIIKAGLEFSRIRRVDV
ncbi:hypothetical protein Ferp_1590 [Ferroglobus placidus DSM 10642]|uniref:Uncharacterized protein n=1 Tax=Ferroglobus placidus (strain DSM 10642 / AEDII12DO) TaxID=589924 RepID=D3RZ26_FERPA|nr:hypothetical protein [Ferroglobus placidus]ADC65739.1 hypothetical protein Ferp_1590 [Ferroglobus placidus DSM 10642]